jgi:chromosome segregation ATPase
LVSFFDICFDRKARTCSKEELVVGTFHPMDEGNLTELLTEMAQLKEKNKCMEIELKEMQERYSEISLKFAEVEGERQQLVMTVRNLKNGKRS